MLYSFLGITLLVILLVAFRMMRMPEKALVQAGVAAEAEKRQEGFEFEVPDIPEVADKRTYWEQIVKFYKKNPEAVIQLIRNWLNED